MEHYAKTKARLFQSEPGKICILPKDCEYFPLFYASASADGTTKNIVTYSMKEPSDYSLKHLQTTDSGMDIGIR